MARNAYLQAPYKIFAAAAANRAALIQTNVFTPDLAETVRVHLEERNVPGVQAVSDADIQTIICITSPRVIHDIRVASGSNWLSTHQYMDVAKKFNGEVGMWGGVRFLKTNRMVLKNAGTTIAQTTLNGATVAGQGAAATDLVVYTPGQAGSTRFITVVSATGLVIGKSITISALASGTTVREDDGSQETRRIVGIAGLQISLDRPLGKAHATGDYVTYGIDIHTSIFIGGPGVVYAIGERPHVLNLPVIDDMAMIRRLGWRGFMKFQLFRPEMFEVVESASSID